VDFPDFLTWRSQLYQSLGCRRSSLMDLLDSLSSNFSASTVAELSLNPLFRRDYNSLYKGIQDFLPPPDHPDYPKAVDGLFSVVAALPERSLYSQRGFLGEQVQSDNLVIIARVRSNRVFYRLMVNVMTWNICFVLVNKNC
jgi:hypothetical protein